MDLLDIYKKYYIVRFRKEGRVHPKTVNDIQVLKPRGPWKSKSGGALVVTTAMGLWEVADFLHQDPNETREIPDIHGLRSYFVYDIPELSVGGLEFHRVRTEMLFTTQGAFEWECEDVYGGKRTFLVNRHEGLCLPPYILHTYRAVEGWTSTIMVVCNTLFDPDDARTHDTFSMEEFREIQKSHR